MINKIKYNGVILVPENKEDAWYHKVFKIGVIRDESFDWKTYRPKFETQRNTFDCTAFARTNCAEYIGKKAEAKDKDGNELNFSDLHLAVGSGISQFGGNLNSPSEYFRKEGIVVQKYCDYDNDMLNNPIGTWQKRRMKVDAIPPDTRRYKGGNHCWVVPDKAVMIDALDYSPLQLAVGLDERWEQGGIVPRCDNPIGYHAVTLEKINKDGTYRIFDSGANEGKILASDYKIAQIKSFRDLPDDWKLSQAEWEAKQKTILNILGEILRKIGEVLGLIEKQVEMIKPIPPLPPKPEILDPDIVIKPPEETVEEIICRVCKEEEVDFGLALRVAKCESGLNPNAKRVNSPKSIDRGLYQWNSHYHPEVTDEMAYDSETACRLFCRAVKAGHLSWWSASKKCWNDV